MRNATHIPELIFARDPLLRRLPKERVRPVAPRVYTTNLVDSLEAIVRRHMVPILSRLFPGAVISHRSAFEMRPSPDGEVFLTYKYTRTVELPGLTVRLLEGQGPVVDDMQLLDLYQASEARAYLENLQPSRSRAGGRKTLVRADIERRLDGLCRLRGEAALQALRDQARTVAEILGFDAEFRQLQEIIGALLRSRSAESLVSDVAHSRTLGLPLDPARLDLFILLADYLAAQEFPTWPLQTEGDAFSTAAFFDAYFSNYIEGTTFTVEEAEAIIFEGRIDAARPQDSHDILGTFRLLANDAEMRQVPRSGEELVSILKDRHGRIMAARPDVRPGQFKIAANRAGNTTFVAPELVEGTLIRGFDYCSRVGHPFARAAYMMFLISEIHPFKDGNGRIARLMMNAELHAQGCSRIVIPTVFRDNYLDALRALTRNHDPITYVRMLSYAWQFTHSIDFSDRSTAVVMLARCQAFEEANAQARLVLPAALPPAAVYTITVPEYFRAHLERWRARHQG